jgi:hypothetical protein
LKRRSFLRHRPHRQVFNRGEPNKKQLGKVVTGVFTPAIPKLAMTLQVAALNTGAQFFSLSDS